MADISKITTPDGASYDIKDGTARSSISTLSGKVLPDVTSSDNGKFLVVVSGAWTATTMTAWAGGTY